MYKAPNLLNTDGTASMATLLMMSHHAFRRDGARFAVALERLVHGDADRVAALQQEWQFFRGALHGHHTVEDTQIFPDLRAREVSLGAAIDRLEADHRKIDPLLERGDAAFAGLPATQSAALELIEELKVLLDEHLAFEETEIVSFLRDAKEFPAPPGEAEAEMYAQGFSWSMHGIAPEVLTQVYKMLPDILTSKLPTARAAFDQRCERVWGSAKIKLSYTSVPN